MLFLLFTKEKKIISQLPMYDFICFPIFLIDLFIIYLFIFFQKKKGLTMILDVAVADESRILDPLLQVLLSNLHALVATSADFSAANANVMKNYNELLRCFEIICIFLFFFFFFLLSSFINIQ